MPIVVIDYQDACFILCLERGRMNTQGGVASKEEKEKERRKKRKLLQKQKKWAAFDSY